MCVCCILFLVFSFSEGFGLERCPICFICLLGPFFCQFDQMYIYIIHIDFKLNVMMTFEITLCLSLLLMSLRKLRGRVSPQRGFFDSPLTLGLRRMSFGALMSHFRFDLLFNVLRSCIYIPYGFLRLPVG